VYNPNPFGGEWKAILAADDTRQALQLSSVIVLVREVAFNERLNGGYEGYDAIRNEVVSARSFESIVHGYPISTSLCVWIGCDKHSAGSRNRMW